MQKNFLLIFLIFLIIVTIFFLKQQSLSTTKIQIKGKEFTIEIAKTIPQKTKGLGNRNSLCENCGMIFVYKYESVYPFWMKDTLIPLDIIWINKFGKIIDIYTANPEPNVPMHKLKIYQNTQPAKFIIELNGGEAQKLNLKVGDQIKLDL